MATDQGTGDRLGDGASVGASLSHVHICTDGRDDVVAASTWRDERDAGGQNVTFYRGGSLIEVKHHRDQDQDLKRAAAVRGAVREKTKRRQLQRDRGGSVRGKVAGFSQKARRRLHVLLAKTDVHEPVLFLTLTVSDQVAHDGRSMKDRYLKRFKTRLQRQFPNAAMVWRLECVPRKSGQLVGQAAGHFHALLWGVPDQPGLREWIGSNWSECVGDKSRTRVEVPRSSRRVQAYCAKLYVSKGGDQVAIDDVGRYWGVLQDDLIPWATVVVRRLTHREAVKLLRVLRRWVIAGRRSRGKRGRPAYLTQWRSFFVGDPGYWADQVGAIIGDRDDPGALLSGLSIPVMVRAL